MGKSFEMHMLFKIIAHFRKYHNALSVSPTFCISIVFSFSWNLQWSPRENQNNAYTKFGGGGGGGTKSTMVYSKVGYIIPLH